MADFKPTRNTFLDVYLTRKRQLEEDRMAREMAEKEINMRRELADKQLTFQREQETAAQRRHDDTLRFNQEQSRREEVAKLLELGAGGKVEPAARNAQVLPGVDMSVTPEQVGGSEAIASLFGPTQPQVSMVPSEQAVSLGGQDVQAVPLVEQFKRQADAQRQAKDADEAGVLSRTLDSFAKHPKIFEKLPTKIRSAIQAQAALPAELRDTNVMRMLYAEPQSGVEMITSGLELLQSDDPNEKMLGKELFQNFWRMQQMQQMGTFNTAAYQNLSDSRTTQEHANRVAQKMIADKQAVGAGAWTREDIINGIPAAVYADPSIPNKTEVIEYLKNVFMKGMPMEQDFMQQLMRGGGGGPAAQSTPSPRSTSTAPSQPPVVGAPSTPSPARSARPTKVDISGVSITPPNVETLSSNGKLFTDSQIKEILDFAGGPPDDPRYAGNYRNFSADTIKQVRFYLQNQGRRINYR